MNEPMPKWLRIAIGIGVLALVIAIVGSWMAQYRVAATRADQEKAIQELEASATGSSNTSDTRPADGTTETAQDAQPGEAAEAPAIERVVLIDGLNFRTSPARDATLIRSLSKGEILKLLKKKDGWYQVADEAGTVGWVSSDSAYTKKH